MSSSDVEVKKVSRRRFVPLKNPLNNVATLTDDNFKKVCKSFYTDLETTLQSESTQLNRIIDEYRSNIKKQQEYINESYKHLFQYMLNHVYDDDKKELLEAISLMLEHPQYSEMFATIIKSAIQYINEGKRPCLIHDQSQYVFGTKPLYFTLDEY